MSVIISGTIIAFFPSSFFPRLTLHHSHTLQKPASHYLDPPPLPPEDLEPPPEPKKEEPIETKIVAPLPDEAGKKGKRNKRRQRVNTPTHTPSFGPPMTVRKTPSSHR